MSEAHKRALLRVENLDAIVAAMAHGKGVLVLTGRFGNWDVATTAAIARFPHMRGKFHFVRRTLKSQRLDRLVTHRVNQAKTRVFPKSGSLDAMLARLEEGNVIVFPFDQYARPPDGIEVDFFGHPAWTFKGLAIIALATGAPVLPAAAWREPDGRHVLRFEEALPLIKCEDTDEAIRRNTLVFNRALERLVLRHPEQWHWMQRRWKPTVGRWPLVTLVTL
jgi:KDO2-lipid IV(A) lauroyltransferase